MIGKWLLTAAAMLFLLGSVDAGEPPDTLGFSFNQDLNTRTWDLRGFYQTDQLPASIRISTFHRLLQRKLPGYEVQWKRDNRIELSSVKQLRANLALNVDFQGTDFQDHEARKRQPVDSHGFLPEHFTDISNLRRISTGQDNRIGRGHLRGGISSGKSQAYNYALSLGTAWDRQLHSLEVGPSLRGAFGFGDKSQRIFQVRGEGRANYLKKRKAHDVNLSAWYNSTFGDAVNRTSISYLNKNSSFLSGTGSETVHRIQEGITLLNQLTTPLYHRITATYDFNLRRSNINYRGGGPGESDQLDVVHTLESHLKMDRWRWDLGFRYSAEDRNYTGILNLGRSMRLVTDLQRKIGEDSLQIHVSTEKYTYNSPNETDNSERDRLLYNVQGITGLRITESLRLKLEISLLLDHLVYLKRERSADNRWNRIFIFRPQIQWRPAQRWSNHAVFEVSANYNDYDFDDLEPGSRKSTVFRRWSAADTLRFPVTLSWNGSLFLRYDLEDQGRLNWNTFTQDVFSESYNRFFGGFIERTLVESLFLQGGYRYQERKEDEFRTNIDGSQTTIPARSYRKYGPFIRIRSLLHSTFTLLVEGDFESIHDSRNERRYHLETITVILNYRW